MLEALDKNNKIVSALDSDYGIYFCPECKKPCGLRKPLEKNYHFYHFKIDEDCSLCYSENKEYFNKYSKEINNKCNEAFEIIIKNTTKENWFEAINCLIEYNQLNRLEGCDLAIKPLMLYYEEYKESFSFSFGNSQYLTNIDKLIIQNSLEYIGIDINSQNIYYSKNIENIKNSTNAHLNYLIHIIELTEKCKFINDDNDIINLFKNEIRKIKILIRRYPNQRLNSIDLTIYDYILVYQYIRKLFNKSDDYWKYFNESIIENIDYDDIGYIYFAKYIKKYYFIS